MRSTSTASVTRPAALALVGALLSCSRPPTRLVFRVLAENLVPAWCGPTGSPATPACPSGAYRLDSVLVRVCRGACTEPEANDCVGNDAELFCRTFVDGPVATAPNVLPGDITVAPADADAASRVGVVVVAVARVPDAGGGQPTIERIRRRFVVPFVKESTQVVEVWLSSLCIGAVCPPETTCGRRSCEPVDDPPTMTFTPLPDAGPLDAGALDASFAVAPRDAGAATVDVPVVMDVPAVIDAPVVADVPVVDVAPTMDVRIVGADLGAADAPGSTDRGPAVGRDGMIDRCGSCHRDQLCCGTTCEDYLTDPANCGACGFSCAAGQSCCNGRCTDLRDNAEHCGACNNACAEGTTCCGRLCADTVTESRNCGACGAMCNTRDRCCEGACVSPVGGAADAGRCGATGS